MILGSLCRPEKQQEPLRSESARSVDPPGHMTLVHFCFVDTGPNWPKVRLQSCSLDEDSN